MPAVVDVFGGASEEHSPFVTIARRLRNLPAVILLLFDLDGTLVDSNADDNRLFLEAVREIAGDIGEVESWEKFPEVTDPAIARAIITRTTGRMAREGEVFQVREVLGKKWERMLEAGEITVRPIPGALEILQAARVRKNFCVAIATGSWAPTAALKLFVAGFPLEELVVATADDAEARAAILRSAAIFAASVRGIPGFNELVIVGDGVWDGRAARVIKAGFVGRCSDEAQALQLRAEGAVAVVPDFSDPERFWNAVDAAVAQCRASKAN